MNTVSYVNIFNIVIDLKALIFFYIFRVIFFIIVMIALILYVMLIMFTFVRNNARFNIDLLIGSIIYAAF